MPRSCLAGLRGVVDAAAHRAADGSPRRPRGHPGTTNTSAPQHFDCKDRNSALYPAAASYIACVVLLPLSLAVDPRYSGMKYFREKSWEQKCAIEEKKLLREWRDQQVLYASQPFRACERATDHALWCGM